MAVLELGIEIKNLGTATSGLKDLQSLLNSFKAVKIDVGADALKLARVEAVQLSSELKKTQTESKINIAENFAKAKIETENARRELIEYNLEQRKLRDSTKNNKADSSGIFDVTKLKAFNNELNEVNLKIKASSEYLKSYNIKGGYSGSSQVASEMKEAILRANELKKEISSIIFKDGSGTYRDLSSELNKSRNSAKDLYAQMIRLEQAGLKNTSVYKSVESQFKNAQLSVNKLDSQIKRLDSALGQNQRNVGNYSGSLANANGVTMEFNRIIQDAPFGMMGIGNNIQQLAANWQVYTQQAKQAAVANGQTIGTMGLLRGVMSNFLTTGNLLTFGIAAITSAWTAYTMWSQRAGKETKETKSELDKFKDSVSDLKTVMIESQVEGRKEINTLNGLKSIYDDTTQSAEKRKSAYNGILKIYEDYNGKLTEEERKVFNLSSAYDGLVNQILASAKARGYANIIDKNTETIIAIEGQILKNSNALNIASNNYSRAEKESKKLNKTKLEGVSATESEIMTQTGLNVAISSLNKAQQKQSTLINNKLKLEGENYKLQQKVLDLTKQGAKVNGDSFNNDATDRTNNLTNSLKNSVKEAKTLSEILKGLYSAAGISEKDLSLVGNVGLDLQLGSLAFDFNKAIEEVKAYQQSVLKDTTLTEEKRAALIQETERTIQYIMGRASAEMITARDKFNEQILKRVEIKPIKTGVAEIPLLEETKTPEWMKENRRLTKELSKEITNIIGMLPQLSGGFQEIFNSLTGGIGALFQKELIDNLSQSLSSKMKEMDEDTKKIAGALSIAGNTLQGLFNKTSGVGQGLGGALSGAGAGLGIGNMLKDTLGKNGGLIGAIAGGAIGLISGIFGSRKRRREEERQRKQLEEQKKTNALLERMNALAYTANIIGGKTLDGIVTGVNRNEFGEITFRIQGRDLVASLDKQKSLNSR